MADMEDTEDWGDDGAAGDGWDEEAPAGDDAGWDDSGAGAAAAPAGSDDWGNDGDGGGDWDDPADVTMVEEQKGIPQLQRHHSFMVLDQDHLQKRMEQLVRTTSEFLFITPEEASCALRAYQWKDKALQDDWWKDQDGIRKKVGLSVRDPEAKQLDPNDKVQCEAAFCDEVLAKDATALSCGHYFCNGCWSDYLNSQVSHGRNCVWTTCMGMSCKLNHNHKFGCACNEMVPQSLFKAFIQDKEKMEKYERWVLDSFVEGQRKIKWCPEPKCNLAVEYPTGGTKDVKCQCGYSFCFSCNEKAHTPAPCDLVKKWVEKEQSDDATEVWLAARTKKCPKCEVRIEKNRACNHMKCVKCGHDFCWLCKGPWTQHGSGTGGYYVCNKYNEESKKGHVSSEEQTMLDNNKLLQKYTYYYKRFVDSQKGIGFTEKLWEGIDKKLKDQDFGRYSFLQDAVQKLIAARGVLQWSYAMAYYLKSGKEKRLFEYQQDLLVNNTERLQDLMENSEPQELIKKRKPIIDMIGAIDKFRREMIKQVENGEFEAVLLANADIHTASGKWICTFCKSEHKGDQEFCGSCQACRKHGEPECKACKKS